MYGEMTMFSEAEACGCNKWNCPICRKAAKKWLRDNPVEPETTGLAEDRGWERPPVMDWRDEVRWNARRTDPQTSHDAAAGDRKTVFTKLIEVFQASDGLTAEEAADRAGFTAADGAWKRVSDLLRTGVLVDTGETRLGASGRSQRVLRINR